MRGPSRRSGDLLSSTLTVDPWPGASRPDSRTTSRTTGSPQDRHEAAQGEERRDVSIGGTERAAGKRETPASALGRGYSRRSEDNTSDLQYLMRTSYAVFCSKKNNNKPRLQQT